MLPECLKVVRVVFGWVGYDESGPADIWMMWILSADVAIISFRFVLSYTDDLLPKSPPISALTYLASGSN